MKAQLLLLFCVLTLRAFCQPYLNSSARWIQTNSWYGFNASNLCNTEYYFDGDTVLNGTQYYKMFRKFQCNYTQYTYDSIGNPITVVTTSTDTLFDRFLREWNSGFYTRVNDTTERREYNFNVHDFLSFDSITPYSTCYPGNASILFHDTVCIGNEQRKSWQVSMSMYPAATRYIEGVGPNSGFAAPICRNGCPECGYSLQYFILNEDTLYHGNCMSTANLPNHDQTTFYFAQNANLVNLSHPSLQQVEVLDMNGRTTVLFSGKNQTSIVINTDGLPEGVYIIRVSTDHEVLNKKFIVQR